MNLLIKEVMVEILISHSREPTSVLATVKAVLFKHGEVYDLSVSVFEAAGWDDTFVVRVVAEDGTTNYYGIEAICYDK